MAVAVSVNPIADVPGWRQFAEETSTGARHDAHVEMLRQFGVTRAHVFQHSTPGGEVEILVWEGVEQEDLPALFARFKNPQSDHQRYIASHVLPNLHGIDLTAEPPPPPEKVSTIEV